MSIKIMSNVWDCEYLAGGELLVMLAIADFANDSGWAWPSVETLAKKARLSERQTQYIIQRMQFCHFLEVEKNAGKGGVNRYRVNIPSRKRIEEAMRQMDSQGKLEPDGGCNDCTGGGAAHCTGGVQPTAPRTVIEPSVLSKESTTEFSSKLKTERMLEAWDRWMEHRRTFKKPKSWTKLFNNQIEFLERYDEATAWEMLDRALINGWQGIYPLKPNEKPTQPAKKHWAELDLERICREPEDKL